MPIRDDSAGSYGTWDNQDLSWLDYLKANASDGGNALANLGRNLVQGFSPVGSSPEGNMAFQVPPIVSGIADSYARLAGTPNNPGNAYNLSGVPELDAPIQQDMSNVLLSLYGGNAVAGLSKPKGALGAGAMREGGDQTWYHGTKRGGFDHFDLDEIAARRGDTNNGYAGVSMTTSPDEASMYAGTIFPKSIPQPNFQHLAEDTPAVYPLHTDVRNPFVWDLMKDGSPPNGGDWGFAWSQGLKEQGYDAIDFVINGKVTERVAISPNTVRSATTGETLFSDTGRPSIVGSALAGAGESQSLQLGRIVTPTSRHIDNPSSHLPMDEKSRFERAQEQGYDTENLYWHGSPSDPFDSFDLSKSGERDGFWGDGVYADGSVNGERTARTYTYNPDMHDPFSDWNQGHYRAIVSRSGKPFMMEQGWPENIKSIFPEYRPPAGPGVFDDQKQAFRQALLDKGYDSIRSRDRSHDVFLRPEQLRDVNAVFDPAHLGENGLLLSDNRPSLLGSALATGGENYDLPDWLRF